MTDIPLPGEGDHTMPIETAYAHKNSKGKTYYLHATKLANGTLLHHFAGKVKPEGQVAHVPAGMTIVESPATGLPMLKRG